MRLKLALAAHLPASQIQCDACETWRIVPNDLWRSLEADNLDTWFCQAIASWRSTLLLSPGLLRKRLRSLHTPLLSHQPRCLSSFRVTRQPLFFP